MWALQRKVTESTPSDPDLMDRILHWRDGANGSLACTPYKFVHNSHRFQADYQTRPWKGIGFNAVPTKTSTISGLPVYTNWQDGGIDPCDVDPVAKRGVAKTTYPESLDSFGAFGIDGITYTGQQDTPGSLDVPGHGEAECIKDP
ncbi:hypothetical protein TruAng_001386 [Truncatella angustata]|nr:hypothetical protein TruAng_001386 [Truncatella angustata]